MKQSAARKKLTNKIKSTTIKLKRMRQDLKVLRANESAAKKVVKRRKTAKKKLAKKTGKLNV